MSEEEIDVLYNEILKLPKVERPITATTMCELNVNDLFDTIREFRKIPEYSDLLNENKRLKDQLQQKENIIKEAKEYVYKMFNTEPANSREYDYHCGKLAEILDKEVN